MDSGAASSQISSLRITRISQSGGRVSVPVKPSQTVFAQFRHISGTPASTDENTVPISKLHLFNRIVSMFQARKERLAGNSELVDLKSTGTKLRGYGAKQGRVTAGLVFNLSA